MRFLWVYLLALLAHTVTQAQSLPLPSEDGTHLEVSLLTVGPGPIYWERFGHNALVIRNLTTGEASAYNYGIFDFDEDDFLLNFMRGRMRYRMATDWLEGDIRAYREEDRWVVEQKLQLTPIQRANLYTFLNWNTQPENTYYHYDYFETNCSTKVRDALDKVLDGELRRQLLGHSRGYSYRMNALRLMEPEAWLALGMDIGLGPYADQRLDFWEESFIPMTLMAAVHEIRVRDEHGRMVPLVSEEITHATSTLAEPAELPTDHRLLFLLLGMVCAGVLILLNTYRNHTGVRVALSIIASTFYLLFGLIGFVLILLWVGTEHHSAWRNENLLLFNPLCFLLLPLWMATLRHDRQPSVQTMGLVWVIMLGASFALFSKILPWFTQANLHWILLILPIHMALTWAVWQKRE